MTAKKEPDVEPEQDEEDLAPAEEDRIVDRVVDRVKGVLADLVGKPAAEPEAEPEAGPVKEPTTTREIETDMEAQVRAAMGKIGAEEDHAKQHETIKKEAERSPVTVGKVTRFLWGGGD